VQRGTSSGRGAGARGPVQCCWRDPGPCNAPGYPRLVQPQWTVRNSCVNRANVTRSDKEIAGPESGVMLMLLTTPDCRAAYPIRSKSVFSTVVGARPTLAVSMSRNNPVNTWLLSG